MDDDRGKEWGSAGGCEGADWDSDEEETECLSLNCSEGSRKRPDNKSPPLPYFCLDNRFVATYDEYINWINSLKSINE